jgi:hypothetical protein
VNVAFPAFLLLLFYLPGAVFLSALTGFLSKDKELPTLSGSLTGRAAIALLFAGLLHLSASGVLVLVSSLFSHFPLRSYAHEFFILLAASPGAAQLAALRLIELNLGWSAGYFLSISLIAGCLGSLGHFFIDRKRLHLKFKSLRFKPQWHYLLSGENLPPSGQEPLVFADIMVELEGRPVIYSGTVRDYWFDDKTGVLEAIYLVDARRRRFTWKAGDSDDEQCRGVGPIKRAIAALFPARPDPVEPEEIPGQSFAIKYSEIKNINLQYLFG